MCVWSAYTGKSPAAPIIWDSLKKIEGIWGGFYTGIVTCSEGKLFMGKVMGNMEVWQQKFALSDFPGNCGLIHSRTNSGGDERWGHPFVGSSGKVAIISQGCSGIFKERSKPNAEMWGNEMLKNGKKFSSSIFGLPERYPVLSDGGQVHSAEVGVQAVEYWYEQLSDPFAAVKKVFSELTNEAASLFIFADRPGVICFSNSNQHLVYQQNADGVYLSISTLGLPGNFGMELPYNSVGMITPEKICFERLHERYETMMQVPRGMVQASFEYIKNNPGCFLAALTDNVLKPWLPADKLCCRAGSAYRVLEILVLDGRVRMEPVSYPGSAGTPGTIFRLHSAE